MMRTANPAHRGDFKAQARAVLQALKAQVEAGGGAMQNIVKVNTYLTDIRHRVDYAPIREEFFGEKDACPIPGWRWQPLPCPNS